MLRSVYLRGEVSRHVSLLQQYPLRHTHPTEQQPNDNNFTTTVAASEKHTKQCLRHRNLWQIPDNDNDRAEHRVSTNNIVTNYAPLSN